MAEITQYGFEFAEVGHALIKAQGLHEGRWTIVIEFAFTATVAGPSEEAAVPAAIVGVNKIQLQRVQEDQPLPPAHLIIDAAKVNPPGTSGGGEETSAAKPRRRNVKII